MPSQVRHTWIVVGAALSGYPRFRCRVRATPTARNFEPSAAFSSFEINIRREPNGGRQHDDHPSHFRNTRSRRSCGRTPRAAAWDFETRHSHTVSGGRNTAGVAPSGGDASHDDGARQDAPLEGEIEVSADIAASQVAAVQRSLGEAGALRVTSS